MRLRIRTKFLVAFFLVTFILLLNSLVSYIAMNRISLSLDDINSTNKKIQIYDSVRLLMNDLLKAPANWINNGDPRERGNFLRNAEKTSLSFKHLEEVLTTNKELEAYRPYKGGYDDIYKDCLTLFNIEDSRKAILMMESIREKIPPLLKIGDSLNETFVKEMDERIAFFRKTRNWAYILLIVQSSGGIILAVVLGIIISKSISRPLERLSGEVELFGKGESYKPLKIRTGDEVEGLAERFNWMASRLEHTLANLRGKVAELEERGIALDKAKKDLQETKDYLEGIVEHSADAIITSDLEGRITSWNKGAEMIYGCKEEEVLGKFLPMIPEFLMFEERGNIEKIKGGKIIKNIEALRKKNDGTIFEVSLTLSPILDPSGNVVGISGISRDLSEKKKVGEELLRKTRELSTLNFINDAMRRTLDLSRLLRIILTSVTMGDGLGFNRAILFLVDEERRILKGVMGVGPGSYEEAWQIWGRLDAEGRTLKDLVTGEMPWDEGSFVDRLAKKIEISLNEEGILVFAIRNKRSFNITDAKIDPAVDPFLVQQFGTNAFAAVPLISKDRVIGLILVDNLFSKRPITEDDMNFLTAFANQAASAIENALLFEKVSKAEADIRNIFDSITDMVFFLDTDFIIRKVNKTVLEKLKKNPEDLVGKKCYEVFPCSGPKTGCPHLASMETRKSAIQEITDQSLGGTFLVSTSPFFNNSGEVIGTVHILRDITEQKRLRERLLHSEKMAALGEMSAKIAHEIRNPLVSIGGFARRLEERFRKTTDKERDYAEIIARETNRLEGILQELMGFVKERPLHIEITNLKRFINDILALLSSDLAEKKIKVVKKLSREDLEIPIDPEQMKQAIINIINNAEQAMGRNGEIHIRTAPVRDSVFIEISDTGAGIPQDIIDNIFNPFFTTKSSGIGLGLAITHRIIEMHGGDIEVSSKEGVGTTFTIKLPLRRTEVLKG